ncbi:zonadhesin-like isoform X1 [Branchiostoma floridae]|uniref:Zonadhesin-like isoform X1 n=2 Tax=Branchiostoma floridae TaxID=7739 RepID=A0A9J7LI77_BRAFL|nr:zonadhesin-like isoform X1 [Branchiostoma floridae]
MDGTGCTKLTRDDLCVMPGRGICRSCGDPHTTMFDRTRHHFQGPCRYTFAKDCGNSSDFTVEVQHVPVPRRPVVSVVREVYVIAYGYEIGILQGNEVTVTVNGVTYTATGSIPFELAMGKIQVTYRGMWVHVRLVEYCVDIFYNGRHCVKVRVTPYYWGRMCGLCGDFNGNRANDFMLPDGTIASNWNDFGHSWLVEDEDDERCAVGPPPPPCPHGLMTVVSANDMCGLIMDHYGPFGVCHDLGVDPQDFFDDCVFDMCARDGDIVGLCENLEAYADACEEAGAIGFTWRSATLCPLPCPPNSHYNPCASPCPATCQNPDAPNQPCITLCVECCECDPGYVMSGPHCVPLEDCGCTDPMTGRYYPLEETWIQNGRRCVCTRNGIVCTECSFDIVFILDRSSSIGPYGMYIAEKYIAYIIRCLHGLDVEVGYIVFDCISKWLISLGLYNVDTTALIPEIKAAEFTGGESRVGNAIYHLMCTANYRNGIPSAAIILTDGVAYEEHPNNLYELQSNAARAMGIELYAVAIGREFLFNLNALANIANGADRVFDVYSCCALAIRLLDDLCDPPCPDGYTSFADTCYKVFANEVTSYTEAQTHCNSEGGHLAMAKDQATNRLLVHLINQESQDQTFYYFGLTYSEEKNAFIWGDGSDLVFSNWRPTEPNRPDEHCTVFCWGQWCDAPCSSSREFEFTAGFICEVRVPCPPGVDLVSCTQDPCVNAECAAHPTAMCKANYCGGCNAVFYDDQGNKVDCMAMNMYGAG